MSVLCDYFGFFFINYCLFQERSSFNEPILDLQPVQRSTPTEFTTEFQWNFINFTWPSYSSYVHAVVKRQYVPENNAMAGIKIYRNRLYIALPRIRPGTPVTLAYIPMSTSHSKNPLLVPYPSWEMNAANGDCSALQSVQSMEIDSRGVMWVIDGMRINNSTRCPCKLVLIDLTKKGRVQHVYTFPDHICLRRGGFLNDIVLDETDGGYAYITDHSVQDPGLVVYSRAGDRAWKIRDSSMFPEKNVSTFKVDDLTFKNLAPIDGIALSPLPKPPKTDREVFYCTLAGLNVYSISTKFLKDEEKCKADGWRRDVRFIGPKQAQSDGMMMDNKGNLYYTLMPLYGVGRWNIKTPYESSKEILDQNRDEIVWPDSFAFDGNGYLYLLANNINKFFDPTYKVTISVDKVLFRVMHIYTGTRSYLML